MCEDLLIIRDHTAHLCRTIGEAANKLGVPEHLIPLERRASPLCHTNFVALGAFSTSTDDGLPLPAYVIDLTTPNRPIPDMEVVVDALCSSAAPTCCTPPDLATPDLGDHL